MGEVCGVGGGVKWVGMKGGLWCQVGHGCGVGGGVRCIDGICGMGGQFGRV